jgi:hypothetical protein
MEFLRFKLFDETKNKVDGDLFVQKRDIVYFHDSGEGYCFLCLGRDVLWTHRIAGKAADVVESIISGGLDVRQRDS